MSHLVSSSFCVTFPNTHLSLHAVVLLLLRPDTPPLASPSAPPVSAWPNAGRGNLRPQLDSAMQDVSDLYLLMEETEKQAVRRALLEERGRYCTFINMLQPVVVRNI